MRAAPGISGAFAHLASGDSKASQNKWIIIALDRRFRIVWYNNGGSNWHTGVRFVPRPRAFHYLIKEKEL